MTGDQHQPIRAKLIAAGMLREEHVPRRLPLPPGLIVFAMDDEGRAWARARIELARAGIYDERP
jgi:hypothetical protein